MILNWQHHPWAGVFPATLCPFHEDESIDEVGLRHYMQELAAVAGIKGVVCNGHTGEIMSLRPAERQRVTQITAEAVGERVKVVSGVSAEGSLPAIDDALEAKAAGADAILLMPAHHWLRFGRTSETAVGFFEDVAAGADIPIIVHQYPAWTKASYSLDELLEMVKIPQVVCIKMGTRDMARWRWDYEQLKEAAPHIPILTCHDEYLLASLLEGSDGALIGFAGFVPELMVAVVHAALNNDLLGARKARQQVDALARIVYNFGEPISDAHQRMKCARWLMGRFPSMTMRRPLRPLPPAEIARIRTSLEEIGYVEVDAKIKAILEELVALEAREAKLGAREAKLGAREAKLGAREAKIKAILEARRKKRQQEAEEKEEAAQQRQAEIKEEAARPRDRSNENRKEHIRAT